MEDYYKIPRLSNSLLTAFKAEVFGTDKPYIGNATQATLDGGNAFHLFTYQPEESNPYLASLNAKQVANFQRMATRARATPVLSSFLKNKATEYEKEYLFELDGLPFKAKLDAVLPRYWHDLKSTASTTREDFLNCFFEFGYDRQTAVYQAATGRYGYFTGVSKKEPHSTFLIDTSKYKKEVKQAREAVIELGRMYLEFNKGKIRV